MSTGWKHVLTHAWAIQVDDCVVAVSANPQHVTARAMRADAPGELIVKLAHHADGSVRATLGRQTFIVTDPPTMLDAHVWAWSKQHLSGPLELGRDLAREIWVTHLRLRAADVAAHATLN